MKIAICDDDNAELQHILNLLSTYQKEHNRKLIYKGFTSSFELASTASQEQYDMYLLDVIMPILSGMELAKEIAGLRQSRRYIISYFFPGICCGKLYGEGFQLSLKAHCQGNPFSCVR